MLRIYGVFFLAFYLGIKVGTCSQFGVFTRTPHRVPLVNFCNSSSLYFVTSHRFCFSSTTRRIPTRVVPSSSAADMVQSCPPKLAFDTWDLEGIPIPPPLPDTLMPKIKGKINTLPPTVEPRNDYTLPVEVVTLTELPPPPEIKGKKLKPQKVSNQVEKTLPVLINKLSENKTVNTIKPQLHNTCVLSIQNFCQLFGRYVVLDSEFTGLSKNDRITEVGCVEFKNFQATGRKFSSLVNPQKAVRPSAHKLTGYTQKFLAKYPTFGAIAEGFLEFLEDSPLIIHHANSDLYFLNKELTSLGFKRLEEHHEIIDTLRIAQNLYKGEKNNLGSLARRNDIDTSRRSMHGALVDAEILAEIFATLTQRHGIKSIFQKEHKNPLFNSTLVASNANEIVKKILRESKNKGNASFEAFFKDRKINMPLPSRLLYMQFLYHPGTAKIYEALIVDFSKTDETSDQLLVNYSIPKEDLKKIKEAHKSEYTKSQYFFGDPYNAVVDLHQGCDAVVFIGELFSSLVVREMLCGKTREDLLRTLRIEQNKFSIKVLPSFHLAPFMHFQNSTKSVYLLLENYDKDDNNTKNTLEQLIEHICLKQYFCFSAMLKANLNRHILKYNQYDWIISEDIKNEKTRNFTLKKPGSKEKATLQFDLTEQTAIFNGEIIYDPDRYILISSTPKITLRVVVLNYGADGEFASTQRLKKPYKVADRLLQALQLKTIRDIPFIEKCELARLIYENAMTINENSVASSYFRQRSINCELPATFRYMHDVFHPMLEKRFPVLLVPLVDKQSIIIGIHRIFFNPDGSQIKSSQFPERTEKRMPLKLSLGKTVGGYASVYHSAVKAKPMISSQINTVFVSEGVENALVIKDTLVTLKANNHSIVQKIYNTLGIEDEYDIRTCVGINGIIDVPIPDSAKNVVILADNDAENIDTKRITRETVEFFLKQGKRVFIALPLSSSGKLDFNDVYMQNSAEQKHEEIAKILCNSVAIEQQGLMGEDTEPLQKTFERIKGIYANALLKTPDVKFVFPAVSTFKHNPFLAPSCTTLNSEETLKSIDADASIGDKINYQYLDLMNFLQKR